MSCTGVTLMPRPFEGFGTRCFQQQVDRRFCP